MSNQPIPPNELITMARLLVFAEYVADVLNDHDMVEPEDEKREGGALAEARAFLVSRGAEFPAMCWICRNEAGVMENGQPVPCPECGRETSDESPGMPTFRPWPTKGSDDGM